MAMRVNPECEAAAIFGEVYNAEPPNLGALPGSPERAMLDVDLDPGTEPFCIAAKEDGTCTLTPDMIAEWGIASAANPAAEPALAEAIENAAAPRCYMLGRIAAFRRGET
jgi:hypothetical protein